jgi:FkbM family methyltransferase
VKVFRHLGSVASFVWNHPANRGRRGRALARAAGWQLYKRATGRTLDVGVYDGYKLRCYRDSTSASGVIYAAGYPDWIEMSFLRHYLRPGDGFVDVGANIGVYTILAASRVGPTGRVASFEPGPETLRRLRGNVELNGLKNVEVHPVAVSDRAGTVSFDLAGGTTGHLARGKGAASAVEMETVRLDDVLRGGGWAAGKMDIEGAEPLALRGAERLLGEMSPPVWLLEVNGLLRRYGFTEAELWGWLAERGWDVCLYDLEQRVLRDCPRPSSEYHNVFAIARGAREEVAARLRGP